MVRQVHKELRWVILRYKIVLSTQIATRIFTVGKIVLKTMQLFVFIKKTTPIMFVVCSSEIIL